MALDLVDWSPLMKQIGGLGDTLAENRLLQNRASRGKQVASGNYNQAAQAAFADGAIDEATQYQGLQRQHDQDAWSRRRAERQDARDAASTALTNQLTGLKIKDAEDDLGAKLKTRVAGIAQTILAETDPQKRAGMWSRFVGADKRIGDGLREYGVDPADVETGAKYLIAEARGLDTQSKVGRYRPSKQGVVDTVTGQIVPGTEQTGAEASEYGTDAKSYIDKDGNIVYTQLSKAGGRKDVELPAGAKWAPGVTLKDNGTEIVPINNKTGFPAAPAIPKDLAGAEAQKAVGKAAGEAQAAIPAAKTTVENAFKTITQLENHPGIDTGTGLSSILDPRSWIAGTDAYNFHVKNRRAQAQSFMGARESLKGAGQVTDFEGKRGEDAIAALETAQSKEQYLEELRNLKVMMQASYDDLMRKASMAGSASPSPASGAPENLQARKQKWGLE
jgi:hypothetical protein